MAEIPATDASLNYLRYCRLFRAAKAGENESPADGVHHPVLQALSWTLRVYQNELYHARPMSARRGSGGSRRLRSLSQQIRRGTWRGSSSRRFSRFSRSVRVPVRYETQTVTMYEVHHNSAYITYTRSARVTLENMTVTAFVVYCAL